MQRAPPHDDSCSDGTLTQDPRRRYSTICRDAALCTSLAAQQLQCAEMEGRTRLVCDAITDFQRIVALRVAERHGRWTFFFTDIGPGSGSSCPRCSCSTGDAQHRDDGAKRGAAENRCDGAALRGSCFTSLRDEAELRGQHPPGNLPCRYASEAGARLDRRHQFQQEYGLLLQRIKAASEGIQDSTTR
ncbi:hypothetical protein NESM_000032600 [Novymonas esmeraldas]|uniref:Uncharacterized protein n=1 Tax=Novymonas esmeraldas TaxID=1808958 RepID=A0AAW0F403_9TRYP